MRIRGKNPCSTTYLRTFAPTARERRQTSFFSQIQPITHRYWVCINFCSVMCYTVLIWALISATLGNNMLLHTDLNQCITFRLIKFLYSHSHSTNFKSQKRMQILTSFVTSLKSTMSKYNVGLQIYVLLRKNSPFRHICNVLYHHYVLSRMLLAL